MADILSNSVSGLLAVQRALTTTGHNVSNANTEGYSRQVVNLSARPPEFYGGNYLGTGTQVQSITRRFDQFVESQLRDVTSESSRFSFVEDFAGQVTGVLGDTETGIAASTDAFFNAAGDVASNPTDITSRQAFLNQASALADRFNRVDAQLAQLDQGIGQQAGAMAREVTAFANEVAALNDKISTAYAQDPNTLPNDLLDRRDKLITDIAERINVRVVDDGAGSLNLSVGTGQPLVTANTASELTASNPSSGLQIAVDGQLVTDRVTGGDLGGMIEAQNTLIQPLRSELGRTAMVISQEVNNIQTDGFDLDGNNGQPLFDLPMTGAVFAGSKNEGGGSADVQIDDATLLTDDVYVARFVSGEWQVSTENDLTNIVGSADPGDSASFGGMTVSFDDPSNAPQEGDILYIDAGLGAAGRVSANELSPREVAADGVDDDGDPSTPLISVGPRDNTNIQRITDLANQGLVGQSTSDYDGSPDPDSLDGETIAGSLASALSQAGSVARTAELQGESARAALDNLEARKQSVSGVNLDEEAAKLMQYQQQYQALARSISIAGDLFQSVLNAVR